MNFNQRVFESYDRTKMLLKVREGLLHQKKLNKIQNRRSQQSSPYRKSLSLNKYPTDIITTFKKKQDDSYLKNKLSGINSKTPHPVINDYFIKIDQRHKMQSRLKREEDKRVIKEQNFALFQRMAKAHSFISPKELDFKYKYDHVKLKIQMSKIRFPPKIMPFLKHSFSHSSKMNNNNNSSSNNNKRNDIKKIEARLMRNNKSSGSYININKIKIKDEREEKDKEREREKEKVIQKYNYVNNYRKFNNFSIITNHSNHTNNNYTSNRNSGTKKTIPSNVNYTNTNVNKELNQKNESVFFTEIRKPNY